MLEWLQKRKPEQARIEPVISNITDGETVSSSDIRMFEVFGNPATSSGAVVTSQTAMRVSAVYACVSLICGAIAQLSRPIYERQEDGREKVEHDYWWTLNEQFSPMWPAAAGWEYLIAQVLLRGDGIAYIQRNRAGVMTGLLPFPRSEVIIQKLKPDTPKEAPRLRYLFNTDAGQFGADQEDVLHLPGLGFDGVCSMSVIQWGARNGIGIALQGDDHAGRFFSERGKPEVAIKAPARMTPAQQDDFVAAWKRKYGPDSSNRGVPLILTEGLDVKELTMSAVDQQLLESRQWQVIDIARAFGVPPHMIGETTKSTSWGTGIEQQSIGFVKYTLGPHLKRFENEINRKLFRTSRYFMEHNADSLMAGDSKAQADYFAKAIGGPGAQGWMAVDEVRRLKNMKPMGGEFAKVVKAGEAEAQRKQDDESEAAATGA